MNDRPQRHDEAATAVTTCRGCASPRLARVLDLGVQPACDFFPPLDAENPDPCWPLALVLCEQCALVQLDHRSPAPQEPLAVESATLKRHAIEASARLLQRAGLPIGSSVREFASHHGGHWIDALVDGGCVAVNGGPAALVVDNHSIIHSEDLESELAERVAALAEDGWLAIEFHHALAQLEEGQFDTVRHGHPLYFTLASWQAACRRHGLSIVDAWTEDVFGGCLVVLARRGAQTPSASAAAILAREEAVGATSAAGFARLDALAQRSSHTLVEHLRAAREQGRRVLAYGAGSKACTLLGVAQVTPDLLAMAADLSPAKQGRRIPGVAIPIVSPERLVAEAPDEVLVLTWDIAAEVVAQLRSAGLDKATFTVPLPTLTRVG